MLSVLVYPSLREYENERQTKHHQNDLPEEGYAKFGAMRANTPIEADNLRELGRHFFAFG